MKPQLRVVVLSATILICASAVAVLSSGWLSESPAAPGAVVVTKQSVPSGSAELQLRVPQVHLAETASGRASRGKPATKKSVPQRTQVEADPNKQRLPMTDRDRVRRRATAVAEKLKLSTTEEEALLTVLLTEQDRRADALLVRRRAPKASEANVRVRAELDSIRAWKSEELRRQFGVERANMMLKRR